MRWRHSVSRVSTCLSRRQRSGPQSRLHAVERADDPDPYAPHFIIVTAAKTLVYAHISAGTDLSRASCPSPPACGGRGRDPARQRREGEVGGAAVRNAGIPHLTPTLSAPRGGEGDISAICLAMRSVHTLPRKRGSRACPWPEQGATDTRGCPGFPL